MANQQQEQQEQKQQTAEKNLAKLSLRYIRWARKTGQVPKLLVG